MTPLSKEQIERFKHHVDVGNFGSLFDPDDALAVLESHEEIRRMILEFDAEDVGITKAVKWVQAALGAGSQSSSDTGGTNGSR